MFLMKLLMLPVVFFFKCSEKYQVEEKSVRRPEPFTPLLCSLINIGKKYVYYATAKPVSQNLD